MDSAFSHTGRSFFAHQFPIASGESGRAERASARLYAGVGRRRAHPLWAATELALITKVRVCESFKPANRNRTDSTLSLSPIRELLYREAANARCLRPCNPLRTRQGSSRPMSSWRTSARSHSRGFVALPFSQRQEHERLPRGNRSTLRLARAVRPRPRRRLKRFGIATS